MRNILFLHMYIQDSKLNQDSPNPGTGNKKLSDSTIIISIKLLVSYANELWESLRSQATLIFHQTYV